MKKRYVYSLLLISMITVSLDQELATANQQATETTSIQAVKEQLQARQNQSKTEQTPSSSAASNELNGNQNSSSLTSASGLFGGEACRPEKVEVTPCK